MNKWIDLVFKKKKIGVNIMHFRKTDMKYLFSVFDEELSNEEIFPMSNSLKEINYYKRVFLLKILFEIEETLCYFFEKNLKELSEIRLSEIRREKIEKFTSSKNVQPFINVINKWFDSKINFKHKHKKREKVQIIDVFEKLQLSSKLDLIEKLNINYKGLFFNCQFNYINDKMNNLNIMNFIRNHLSHEYWCLGNSWIDSILFNNKGNKYKAWKGSSKYFFLKLSKDFKVVHNDIMTDAYLLTLKSLSNENKKILKKYKNTFFIL